MINIIEIINQLIINFFAILYGLLPLLMSVFLSGLFIGGIGYMISLIINVGKND